MSAAGVTSQPGLRPRDLDLEGSTITWASTARVRWGKPKDMDTRWEIAASGPGCDLIFRGQWLALALLGTHAGWPEPP